MATLEGGTKNLLSEGRVGTKNHSNGDEDSCSFTVLHSFHHDKSDGKSCVMNEKRKLEKDVQTLTWEILQSILVSHTTGHKC